MKRKTLEELGKGLITFGNSVGALSIVNGLFNFKINTPTSIIVAIIFYVIIESYIGGILLLEKGESCDT